MPNISRSEMLSLLTAGKAPCVSIVLPTHEAGVEVKQAPIRLKNLLRTAERILLARGYREAGVRALLEPARELLLDQPFWRTLRKSLALLLSPGGSRLIHLPYALEEFVLVSDRFFVKPFLPLLNENDTFYILAISRKSIRLFEAGRFRVREIDLGEIPRSLPEALGEDLRDPHLQWHTGTPAGGDGKRRAMFHGHGEGTDDSKMDLERFFQYIDNRLSLLMENRKAPLVIAAVNYLIPIYRSVSKHPRVMERGVEGNPENLRAEELRDRALEIVKPELDAARKEDAGLFDEMAAAGKGSDQLEEVLAASFDGRVDTLFVGMDGQVRGTYVPEERRVELTNGGDGGERPDEERDELLDRAAFESLMRGATVYGLPREEIPGGGELAAILRY